MMITHSGVKEIMQICHIRLETDPGLADHGSSLHMVSESAEHRAPVHPETAGTEYSLEGNAANPALQGSGRSFPGGAPKAQDDASTTRVGCCRDAGGCLPAAS
jgi:hypothetical protein